MAHSNIGASGAERWFNCPGSVALCEQIPERKNSAASVKGTVAHMLAEEALRHLQAGVQPELPDEGTVITESGFDITVDAAMIAGVEVYLETIKSYINKYRLLYSHDLRVEVPFNLTTVDKNAFGTCDAVLVVPFDRIIILDYKNGYNTVEVDDNKQLMYYALGAYYDLPDRDRADIVRIEMVIIQPNARHIDGPVREQVITVDRLLAFEGELCRAVERTKAVSAPLASGKWCQWCSAKAICPEMRKELGRRAKLDFDRVDSESIEEQLPAPASLDPTRLAVLMENATLLKDWCDDILKIAKESAERGIDIPGYKLVTTWGHRKWVDEDAVITAFEPDLGEAIYTKKLRSPAQVEKLLKKRKGEVEAFTTKPETGKTLVPISDSREARASRAVEDFSS